MNKCAIVRDLIPLYVDGETSADSTLLVSTHIENCPECREYYRSCKHIPRPRIGIVGKKHYRFSVLAGMLEMQKMKEAAAVAALTATAVTLCIYQHLRRPQ